MTYCRVPWKALHRCIDQLPSAEEERNNNDRFHGHWIELTVRASFVHCWTAPSAKHCHKLKDTSQLNQYYNSFFVSLFIPSQQRRRVFWKSNKRSEWSSFEPPKCCFERFMQFEWYNSSDSYISQRLGFASDRVIVGQRDHFNVCVNCKRLICFSIHF